MELFIIIVILLILLETTILTIKSSKKPLINNSQKRKLYVDTSALMDPRLLEVAHTGIISDDVIVPRSVLRELQLLADGKDRDRRNRARAALDRVKELERVVYFNLTILNDELNYPLVDDRLIELAKANHGTILTNDYNLCKVAAAEQIDAYSLNSVALALRSEFLPGERAMVKITEAGSNPGQGVGHLKDGTMVVVEKASKHIGNELEVEFLRLNQNAAGTILFAKIAPKNKTKV